MSHSKIRSGGSSGGIGNDFPSTKAPIPSTPTQQPSQINDLLNRGVGNAMNNAGFGSKTSQTWSPDSPIVSLKSRSSSGSKPDTGGDTKPDSTSGGKRKRDDETDPNNETDDKKKKKKRDDEDNASQTGAGSPTDQSGATPEDALMNIVLQRTIQRQTQTRQKMQEAMKIKDEDD
ncbi:protein popB [Ralstonia solanacearum]|uniref:hypothetical protein n=1 Tax=Ralstonia solanacearum TaxID=305 RepID=UPI0007D7B1AC|nr:hypothetical protein [Ralstonia solanacearum]OAI59595.1 protein popB [Ralstonia solanacearum]